MGSFTDKITTFCAPSQVNLLFGVIGFVLAFTSIGIAASFGHLFVTLVWCFILNYMCSINWTTSAWILVLWPFLLLLIFIFIVLFVVGVKDVNYVIKGGQGGQGGPGTVVTPGFTRGGR